MQIASGEIPLPPESAFIGKLNGVTEQIFDIAKQNKPITQMAEGEILDDSPGVNELGQLLEIAREIDNLKSLISKEEILDIQVRIGVLSDLNWPELVVQDVSELLVQSQSLIESENVAQADDAGINFPGTELFSAVLIVGFVSWIASNLQLLDGSTIGAVVAALMMIQGIAIYLTLLPEVDVKEYVSSEVKEVYNNQVACIVPIWKEDIEVVETTLRSILTQNYPTGSITLIVSDDGVAQTGDEQRQQEIVQLIEQLSAEYPDASILYNIPPEKGSPERRGEGKAGNLNSALELIRELSVRPEIVFTQDANDVMVSSDFMNRVVHEFNQNEQVGFVQSRKEEKAEQDPLHGSPATFYQYLMVQRQKDNAAHSCGSGVAYSLNHLKSFAPQNLVEDLTTSLEILKTGAESRYLPDVVGAKSQTELDFQTFFKQRTTYALDQWRLVLFENMDGLNLRQKLQFLNPATLYTLSASMLILVSMRTGMRLSGQEVVETVPSAISFFTFLGSSIPLLFNVRAIKRSEINLDTVLSELSIQTSMVLLQTYALIKAAVQGRENKEKYMPSVGAEFQYSEFVKVLPNIVIALVIMLGIIAELSESSQGLTGNSLVLLDAVYASLHLSFASLARFTGDEDAD